jgi:hypothetical protein
MPFAIAQIRRVSPVLHGAKSGPTRPPSDFYTVSERGSRSPLVTSGFSSNAADVAGYDYIPVPTGRRRTIMSRNTSRNAQT